MIAVALALALRLFVDEPKDTLNTVVERLRNRHTIDQPTGRQKGELPASVRLLAESRGCELNYRMCREPIVGMVEGS